MPTTRPRHFLTESDELGRALDAAAERWPGLSRPQLLVRLALEGDRVSREAEDARVTARRSAVERHRGSLSGMYATDERDTLREEWPE